MAHGSFTAFSSSIAHRGFQAAKAGFDLRCYMLLRMPVIVCGKLFTREAHHVEELHGALAR